MKKIATVYPFRKLVFDPIPNGESRQPQAAVICGPKQNVYDGEKMFRKFAAVSEKIWVKDFLWGQFPPSTGASCRKEMFCHIMVAGVGLLQ